MLSFPGPALHRTEIEKYTGAIMQRVVGGMQSNCRGEGEGQQRQQECQVSFLLALAVVE